MNFNEKLPEWKNTGTEPSEELKTNGFQSGYKPPANIFNWFWNRVTKAITELQTKLTEEETARTKADTTLQGNIDSEATARTNGDSALLNSLDDHKSNTSNPHSVTKSQLGLGNVPNVSTNNQTPTYTRASTLANLTSGENLSTAFGKISKAVYDFISHKSNTSNPHSVTKSQLGLGNVDNTADADKPVSTATQELLDNKADKTDIIPNNDSFSEGNTNEIGWYRIGQINNNNYGAGCNSCEIIISRYWATLPNEYHHIYFTGIYKSRQFNSVSNKSLEQMFDKIRYSESSDGSIGYLDIHSQYKSVNGVTVKLLNKKNSGQEWQSVWEYLGTGELTEQVIYNIPANSELITTEQYGEDILWSGDTAIDDIITINLSSARSNYRYLALQFYAGSGADWYQPLDLISKHIPDGCLIEYDIYGRSMNITANSSSLVLEDTTSGGIKYNHLVKVIGVK